VHTVEEACEHVTFVDLRCACTVCSTTWRRAIHEVNKHADYPYRYSTCDSRDNNASRGSARVRPRGSQRGTCTSSLPRYISRRHDELDIQQGNRDHRAQKKKRRDTRSLNCSQNSSLQYNKAPQSNFFLPRHEKIRSRDDLLYISSKKCPHIRERVWCLIIRWCCRRSSRAVLRFHPVFHKPRDEILPCSLLHLTFCTRAAERHPLDAGRLAGELSVAVFNPL
jgi:hypothetical protein